MKKTLFVLSLGLFFIGCGGGSEKTSNNSSTNETIPSAMKTATELKKDEESIKINDNSSLALGMPKLNTQEVMPTEALAN